MNTYPSRPVVLCLSGHDPSGGAGLQADIEALLAIPPPSLGSALEGEKQDQRRQQRGERVEVLRRGAHGPSLGKVETL